MPMYMCIVSHVHVCTYFCSFFSESGQEDNGEEGEEVNPAMSAGNFICNLRATFTMVIIIAVMDFFEDDQNSDQGPPDNIHIIPPSQHSWEVHISHTIV